MTEFENDFEYRYRLVEEISESCDFGEYKSYGIAAYRKEGNCWKLEDIVKDISTSESYVREMADNFNSEKLLPIHLRDVIEDELIK
jgi:hypothetical protein